MEKGYVHVYTGNGKGKTTAAFGLALRAALAGKHVYVGQFVKSMAYHEVSVSEVLPQIEIHQYGDGCFIGKNPEPKDVRHASEGLKTAEAVLASGAYEVVILDELCIALYFELLPLEAVMRALEGRHPGVEVVITGRYAPEPLIAYADLVTEMREVKHYYEQGVAARDGIER